MHRLLSLKVFLAGFLVCFGRVVYAQTPGFFLDDHAKKTADLQPFKEYEKPAADADVTIQADYHSTIRSDAPAGTFWHVPREGMERHQKFIIKE